MIKKSHLCPPGTLTGEVDAVSPASASFFGPVLDQYGLRYQYGYFTFFPYRKMDRIAPAPLKQV